MKVADLKPPAATRVKFSLSDQRLVPQHPGCYVLVSFVGEILYIGKAENLRSRFRTHRDSEEKRGAVNGKSAHWFYFAQFSKNELFRVERGWLHQYETLHAELPRMNKIHSPVS